MLFLGFLIKNVYFFVSSGEYEIADGTTAHTFRAILDYYEVNLLRVDKKLKSGDPNENWVT